MNRKYDLSCPLARTLAVIGERWTALILRDLLLLGPQRFQDLQASLGGIAPNTLSARLKGLEEHQVIERQFYENHPPRAKYALTEKGRALGPVLKAMRDWGETHTAGPRAKIRVPK
ncbi:MAG: transcriptional regulator [Candidatus Latescibacteria bacterium]|nr:transcriptional regulator [Candidatus Latescibacterota bacterium]